MSSQFNPEGNPSPLAPVEIVTRRPPTPPRRRSAFGLVLMLLLVLALGGSMFLNLALLLRGAFDTGGEVRERFYSHARTGTQKVAILSIEGMILDGEGFVKRQIDRAIKDDSVKAVVLRIDSPGGSVNAAAYMYHHLRKLGEEAKKPIVVSMGGVRPAGATIVRWPSAPRPTRSSPNRPRGPVRSG